MARARVALGFTNTVDYEAVWDAAALERLMSKHGLVQSDVLPWPRIDTMRQLLGTVLWHFSQGSGCGQFVENGVLFDELLSCLTCKITLGGTAVRAALVLNRLGIDSVVHLVSTNEPTRRLLPPGVQAVCAAQSDTLYPHLSIQFPEGAQLHALGKVWTAPRSNRAIFTDDVDNASLPLTAAFFEKAQSCSALVLSSFDIIQDRTLLESRLADVQRRLAGCLDSWVFYEDAHFSHADFPNLICEHLLPLIDFYSLNEDEFCARCGRAVCFEDPGDVLRALEELRAKIPARCLILHTQYWALAYGQLAPQARDALKLACAVAATRFRLGDDWTLNDLAQTSRQPPYPQGVAMADHLTQFCSFPWAVQPGFTVTADVPTTIGLGDSFVGGFTAALCKNEKKLH